MMPIIVRRGAWGGVLYIMMYHSVDLLDQSNQSRISPITQSPITRGVINGLSSDTVKFDA
jgi:hypothetical protein